MQANELRTILADNVRCRRQELGLTQKALAESVGVTQPRIAQIESGIASIPADSLAAFAESLGTTPAALVTPGNFSKIPA